MGKTKIIGLPVLVSARFHIVLDQNLCRLYKIPENGKVQMQMNDTALFLYSADVSVENDRGKRITIGRFNLLAQWVKLNHVKVGKFVYLLATTSCIQVKSTPWEAVL